ncbi:MAG: hypothetical protein ACREKL_15285 [Chthoniobacterales bacterium]
MAASSPASVARLVGLLIVGILFLAGIGLFGVQFAHDEGGKALRESVASSALLDEARNAQVTFKIQVQDWKNFLIRGHDPGDFDKYTTQFADAEAAVGKSLDALKASPMLPANLQQEVASIRDEHTRLGGIYRDAMKTFTPSKLESTFNVDASVRGIDQKLTQRIDAVAQQILADERTRVDAITAQFERRYDMLRKITVSAAIVVLALLALVVWRGRATAR